MINSIQLFEAWIQLHGLCLLVVSGPGFAAPMPDVGLELLAAEFDRCSIGDKSGDLAGQSRIKMTSLLLSSL
jgi:hypothetical protein